MQAARTRTAALSGDTAHLVMVEADISPGLPATAFAGLPESAMRETRDRVRAAIVNSGGRWPDAKITLSLAPAGPPIPGAALDLAIAVAVMAAGRDIPEPEGSLVFLAELGLDGQLRPVQGVLRSVPHAAGTEAKTVVVACASQAEAFLAPGVTVIAADRLADVATWLQVSHVAPGELDRPGVRVLHAGGLSAHRADSAVGQSRSPNIESTEVCAD